MNERIEYAGQKFHPKALGPFGRIALRDLKDAEAVRLAGERAVTLQFAIAEALIGILVELRTGPRPC